MRRRLALTQRIAAAVALGFTIAAVALLVVAAETTGTTCTFDNFGCRRNQLVGDAVRCLVGGVAAGVAWALLRARRSRQSRRNVC